VDLRNCKNIKNVIFKFERIILPTSYSFLAFHSVIGMKGNVQVSFVIAQLPTARCTD